MKIEKIQDEYSAFFQSKLKAQDALGEIIVMNFFLEDIRKWKNEFQKNEKKLPTLSSHELHSYHTSCSQSLK